MDNMLLILGVVLILVVLLLLVVVSKRKKSTAQAEAKELADSGSASKANITGSKQAPHDSRPSHVAKPGKAQEAQAASVDDEDGGEDGEESASEEEPMPVYELDDDPVAPTMVNVSYEEVDQLAEFNVYKQYGYFDQAAEALGEYLRTLEVKPQELVWEYVGLYLEIGDIDGFTKALDEVKGEFSKNDLEEVVRMGISLDPDNIALRVFADTNLGWGVSEVSREVEVAEQAEQVAEEKPVEEESDEQMKSGFGARQGVQKAERVTKGKPLVQGYGRISAIARDEVGAIAGLAPETKAAKLLTPEVDYTYGCTLYNRAIAASAKPENIIVDAMVSDAKNRDIDNFARHLWDLYMALGKSGRDIKSKMLGWGYSLGVHPLFQILETNPVELQLKEIGVEYGFVSDSASQIKAQMKPLVNQSTDKRSKRVFDKVGEVLQEAETQLQYGQVDEAIATLEEGVMAHTQDPQLYSMLFDLYERSESWSRFNEFSIRIRNEISDLPEEVAVALSHLKQRMESGGAA